MPKRFRLLRFEDALLEAAGNVLSKQEYDEVLDRAERFSYRFTSITLLLSLFLSIACLLPLGIYYSDQQGLSEWQTFLCLIIAFTPLATVCFFIKKKEERIKRKFFSKYLNARGLRPDRCLMCGYVLRGTTANQCPECGEVLASVS